jgi:hypothetical protein
VLTVDAKVTPFSSAVVGVRDCGSGCTGRTGRSCRVALVKKRWVGQRTAVVVKRRDLQQGCNAAGGRVSE